MFYINLSKKKKAKEEVYNYTYKDNVMKLVD